MEVVAFDPRANEYYTDLLNDCVSVIENVLDDARWLAILGYFQLGDTIRRYEIEGKIQREYGARTIKCLVEDLRNKGKRVSESSISRALGIRQLFGTEEYLKQYYNEHPGLTLTYIREELLPKETEHPERYGGIDAVANEKLMKLEGMGNQMEELSQMLHNPEVSPDVKEQIVGTLNKSFEVLQEATTSPSLPKAKVNRSEAYLSFIRQQPCLVCHRTPSEAAHTDKAGVSLKGSDYYCVPLCYTHHADYHRLGAQTFENEQGLDLRERVYDYLVTYILLLEDAND